MSPSPYGRRRAEWPGSGGNKTTTITISNLNLPNVEKVRRLRVRADGRHGAVRRSMMSEKVQTTSGSATEDAAQKTRSRSS